MHVGIKGLAFVFLQSVQHVTGYDQVIGLGQRFAGRFCEGRLGIDHGKPRRPLAVEPPGQLDDALSAVHTADIEAINRRLGYRLMPRAVTFPDEVRIGEPFEASVTWANAGVAPCYGGGFGAFTLKDEQGGIVSVLSDESFDLRGLEPSVGGERPSVTRTAVFRVGHLAPVTRPGVYDVYLSVGRRDGTPQLALPLVGEDGQRRYRMGRVILKPAD